MLEIIALFFLCRKNGELAERKGLKPITWKIYTIVAWLIAEILGVILGMMIFGKDNIVLVLATGLFGAFGGYLFIRHHLENIPDSLEEDVNHIGVDDLQPPKQ